MKRVFCFGELLLRLSPQLNGEWIRGHSMPVFMGGAELNVATALARWGVPVGYGTALPDNYLSKEIIAAVQQKNIDTRKIIFSGNRIGTYYLPQGADLKNAGVIYDRAHSSFWDLKPGQINWEEVFKEVDWFHFSAISPALNANVAAVCREGLEIAHKKGIPISVDLNYRQTLWQWGVPPQDVMPELVQYCAVVMGNLWAAEKMLGVGMDTNPAGGKEAYLEASLETSQQITRRFPACTQLANTFRFDEGEEGVRYYATLYSEGQLRVSPELATPRIVDKVGSGDCFMAGLIYGNHQGLPPQEIIDFAAAAAFTKLFVKGDATTASVHQIKKAYGNYG